MRNHPAAAHAARLRFATFLAEEVHHYLWTALEHQEQLRLWEVCAGVSATALDDAGDFSIEKDTYR